mmetsp:Transcript_80238/g.217395  ORF Transcript_80238/g.217395 Transcript_80238/m.217395 type:complete len:204 (-) Transcript_80238:43-654(-)
MLQTAGGPLLAAIDQHTLLQLYRQYDCSLQHQKHGPARSFKTRAVPSRRETPAAHTPADLGPSEPRLEDGNDGVVDMLLRSQNHHARNPANVPDFAQLHPPVEDPEVILLLQSHPVHVDVLSVDQVLNGLEFRDGLAIALDCLGLIELFGLIEERQVLRVGLQRGAHRGLIPDLAKLLGALWVEVAEGRVQRVVVPGCRTSRT